jgi:predicted RNA-binding Zn ribbon-like protein
MAGARAEKHQFELDGGTLSLDFVNTMSGLRGASPQERLLEFADLVYWAEQVRLLDRRSAARLYKEAEAHPAAAAQRLREAVSLRESLHDTVRAAIDGKAPPPAALAAVNGWIAEALASRRLHPAGGGRFESRFEDDRAPLAFLRPVALDAAELLEHELGTGRVRLCGEAEVGRCGWLFLDETKNASRRFCSMADCGNRAKQRRFQERRRSEQER